MPPGHCTQATFLLAGPCCVCRYMEPVDCTGRKTNLMTQFCCRIHCKPIAASTLITPIVRPADPLRHVWPIPCRRLPSRSRGLAACRAWYSWLYLWLGWLVVLWPVGRVPGFPAVGEDRLFLLERCVNKKFLFE